MKAILTLLSVFCTGLFVGCYPISAFHGRPGGYCLWNSTNRQIGVRELNTGESHVISGRGYVVMPRQEHDAKIVSIRISETKSKIVDLSSKYGNLSNENGIIWMHLIIQDDGDVQPIDKSTLKFFNEVILPSSPEKDW